VLPFLRGQPQEYWKSRDKSDRFTEFGNMEHVVQRRTTGYKLVRGYSMNKKGLRKHNNEN
jgi:hypothetical protein